MALQPTIKRSLTLSVVLLLVGTVALLGFRELLEQRSEARGGRAAGLIDYGAVPPFTFTGADGKPFGLADLKGRVWVADFIFTSCAGTCPRMSTNMARLQAEFADRDEPRFVSITCDPKRDTPERLREYGATYRADFARWHFLTGEFETLQSFSRDCLKLALRTASPEEVERGLERVVHSTRFVLIDRGGHVRGYYDGTEDAAVAQLIEDLRVLLARQDDAR